SFASSLPTREAVKDAGGNLKTEKLFTYNTIINSIPVTGNTNLKTGVVGSSPTGSPVIVVSTYIPQTGRAELIQTVNKQYENGTVLTTTENNTYDGSRYYLKSSQTKNSKQEEIITYFDYPADFNGTAPYSDMVLKNMIAAPVQQTQHNMATPLASEMVRVKTNYQTWNGNTFIGASTIQQSISGGPAKTVFTTNKYDAKGNILQTTDKAGIVTSYIWGYNGMYPVAQITGADHNTVIAFVNQALINNPNTTDQQIRDELNLIRTGLAGTKAQVTTFTHEPLIGITSQTDANNRTVFYEYDGHNRLTLLRNQDGFIVKKICYKYNGEPEDCGQAMYGNEAQSMIFIRNNCGAGYTGSAVTYTVAANTYFSAVSVAEANTLALAAINANGQAFANNNGNCVPANPCGTCPGPDKKCINSVCETGIRVNTNSYQDLVNGYWVCEYHYEFSDGSWSETLTENNSYPCFVGN
ncbi:MAG: hypothetical protein JNM68_12625, partial [Dinghuibacter sp.]|nr:hypothetical protein [Dinghuibacter sp.]